MELSLPDVGGFACRAAPKRRKFNSLKLHAARDIECGRRHVLQTNRAATLRALKMGVRRGFFGVGERKAHGPFMATHGSDAVRERMLHEPVKNAIERDAVQIRRRELRLNLSM